MPAVFDLILRVVVVLALILCAVLAGCLLSVGGWFVALGAAVALAIVVTVRVAAAAVCCLAGSDDERLPRAQVRRGGRAG